MKRKIIKKIGQILTLVVLVLLFLSSCSPSSASAAEDSFLSDVLQNTRFSNFLPFPWDNIAELFENWAFTNYERSYHGSHGGGGRSRSLAYGDALAADFSGGGSSGVVSPVYTFNGKMRLDYTNGNYEIVNTAISFTSNRDLVSGGSYTGIDNYTTLDFGRSNSNLPTVGTWFFVRLAYDSAGELIDSSNFAFCFDDMPIPYIFSNGDYGFYQRSAYGTYYHNNGTVSRNYMNDNTVRFYNNATINSISFRSDLDWNDRYSDEDFFQTDYSLTHYYSSLATSNNDDFINLVKTRSNPSLTSPIVKVGIGARTVINESNVNNYTSFTYDNDTVIYNYDNYVSNYTSTDENIIKAAVNTIYGNQPAPNQNFDSPVRYDYIVSAPLSSDYLPAEWLDTYGQINTTPNLNIDSWLVPPTSATLPADIVSDMTKVSSTGIDLLDIFGLTAPFVALALIGVIYKFLS